MTENTPQPSAPSTHRRKREVFTDLFIDRVFGFDFFIAYTRRDADSYAVALADELRGRGFKCFLDKSDFGAGDHLTSATQRALKKTTSFILVGSPRVYESTYVLTEVKLFSDTQRKIVPINIGDTLERVDSNTAFHNLISERIRINESLESLNIGPSVDVIGAVLQSFKATRQDTKRIQIFGIATLVFAAVAAFAVFFALKANAATQVAQEQRAETEKQRAEAVRQKEIAEQKTQEAEQNARQREEQRTEANTQRESAERRRLEAEKQRQIAERRRRDAEEQRQIAENQTILAVKRQREAEYQQKVAKARQLSAQAGFVGAQYARNLDLSFLLGIESMKRLNDLGLHSLENDQILRNAISLLPRLVTSSFIGLKNGIRRMAYSHQGRYLALAENGLGGLGLENVRIWDTVTQSEMEPLKTAEGVWHVGFSKPGNYLAAISYTNGVYLWKMSGKPILIKELYHVKETRFDENEKIRVPIDGVVFSDDEKLMATVGRYMSVCVWRTDTGEQLKCLPHLDGVTSDLSRVSFNRESTKVAFAGEDLLATWSFGSDLEPEVLNDSIPKNTVIIFGEDGWHFASVEKRNLILRELFSRKEIGRVRLIGGLDNDDPIADYPNDFSGDFAGEYYLHAETARLIIRDDNTVTISTIEKVEEIKYAASPETRISHEDKIRYMDISPDGKYIATGSNDGTVGIWEMNTGEAVARFPVGSPAGVLFRPDGKHLATASWHHVDIWEVLKAPEGEPLPHAGIATTLASSQDQLMIGLDNKTVEVWNLAQRQFVTRASLGCRIESMALSPDGQFFAAGGEGQVKIWRTNDGSEAVSFKPSLPVTEKLYLAFSPDGNHLAVAYHKQVFILDTNTGKEYRRIVHDNLVKAIMFSPDGNKLITGQLNGTVRVFFTRGYVQTAEFVTEEGYLNSFALSPDSRLLALAGSKVVLEIATGSIVSRLRDDVIRSSFNFSPDGKYLVSTDRSGGRAPDNLVKIWDVATGREVSRMVHRGKAVSAVFTSTGEYLATTDGSVRLWRWRPSDLIEQAKAHLTRNLTCEEWEDFVGENEPYEPARNDLPACQRLRNAGEGKTTKGYKK